MQPLRSISCCPGREVGVRPWWHMPCLFIVNISHSPVDDINAIEIEGQDTGRGCADRLSAR